MPDRRANGRRGRAKARQKSLSALPAGRSGWGRSLAILAGLVVVIAIVVAVVRDGSAPSRLAISPRPNGSEQTTRSDAASTTGGSEVVHGDTPVASPSGDSELINELPTGPTGETVAKVSAENASTPNASQPNASQPRQRLFEDELKVVLPTESGWDTEAISELAKNQLKLIGKLLAHPEELDLGHLEPIASANYHGRALRPDDLHEVYHQGEVLVLRDAGGDQREFKGREGLLASLHDLRKPVLSEQAQDPQFKLYRVSQEGDRWSTTAYFESEGPGAEGLVQQNSQWICDWEWAGGDAVPQLLGIRVVDFEEIVLQGRNRPLYTDCTEGVLGRNESYRQQLLYGLDHWRSRMESRLGLDVSGHYGVAVGDVNNDGLHDVYVLMNGGLPNRLYLGQTDGRVLDVSEKAGVDWLDGTPCGLFLDLDNDGDQDLVVGMGGTVVVQENDGQGIFTVRAALPAGSTQMLAAADYDLDGDLDLYSCSYGPSYEGFGSELTPIPFHDANNGTPNFLFRNDGDWKFTDVTVAVGLDENNRRYSFAASWEDFDNDGDPDLLVANDFGRKNLYRNDGGHFKDVAAAAGVEDISAGMSAAWGDYNNDGRMDMYSGNMFSAAGNRVSYQRQFKPGVAEEHVQWFRRHARGNSLFENAGDGTFRDVSLESGVTMGRWSWGSIFADINNDGWQDILVANGYVTGQLPDDL